MGAAFGFFCLALVQVYIGIFLPQFAQIGHGAELVRIIRHGYLAPMFISAALLMTTVEPWRQIDLPQKRWIALLSFAVVLLFLQGLLRRSYMNSVLLELGCYVSFVVSVVVGANQQYWPQVDRLLKNMFYIGFSFLVVRLPDLSSGLRSETVRSISYYTQYVTFAWPYLFFTQHAGQTTRRFFGAAGLVQQFIMNIMFQKRAPTIRVLFALLLFLRRIPSKTIQKRRISLFVGTVTMGIGALLLLMKLMDNSDSVIAHAYDNLEKRFVGRAGIVHTVQESERYDEARWILADMSWPELIFWGKGLGGGATVPTQWGPGVVVQQDGAVYQGVREPHIGLLQPVVKGGFLFGLIFIFGWLWILIKPDAEPKDIYRVACRSVVAMTLPFMLIESLWGTGGVEQVILSGLMIGRCSGIK